MSFNRDKYVARNKAYPKPRKEDVCIFCSKQVGANDSFRNVNPENGDIDYFHFVCFKVAVNNMIQKRKDELANGSKNSEQVKS